MARIVKLSPAQRSVVEFRIEGGCEALRCALSDKGLEARNDVADALTDSANAEDEWASYLASHGRRHEARGARLNRDMLTRLSEQVRILANG